MRRLGLVTPFAAGCVRACGEFALIVMILFYKSIFHLTNRNNTTQPGRAGPGSPALLITPLDTISPFFTSLVLGLGTGLTITPDHNQRQ